MFSDKPFTPRLVRFSVIVALAMTLPASTHARQANNAVTHWNSVATDAFAPSQGTNPMIQSRTLAILHAAIHDALNAIDRRFGSYTPGLDATPQASVDARRGDRVACDFEISRRR